jgi:hypothetical protein
MYIYNPNKFSELIYIMPSSLQFKKIFIDCINDHRKYMFQFID